MLKKSITYTDYNDVEVTEDFYFNFTKIEIAEMLELEYDGGIEDTIKKLTETNDAKKAYELFKKLILDAYGKKSEDGKRFIKNEALRTEFEQSPALSELIIEFLQNPSLGAVFIEGTLPKSMVEEVKAAQAAKTPGLHKPQDVAAMQGKATDVADITAAADERLEGADVRDTGVAMSTSEKRMYTQEELDAIQGVPGTVPPEPVAEPVEYNRGAEEYTDGEILKMKASELSEKGLLLRAYELKNRQQ